MDIRCPRLPPPKTRLYAEVLQNTRTATITAVLPQETWIGTAFLYAQGSSAVLGIDRDQVSVALPAPLDAPDPIELDVLKLPTAEISVHLTLETTGKGKLPTGQPPRQTSSLDASFEPTPIKENIVPWTAEYMNSLGPDAGKGFAACRWCSKPLVALDAIRGWKALPRDGWEETLDLWHCCRPNQKDNGNEGTHPATNSVQVAQGLGLVGLLYFLVTTEDVTNVKEVEESTRLARPLECAHCKRGLGSVDRSTGGWRLLKRSLKLELGAKTEKYQLERWFAAELLQLIDCDRIRRFLVVPTGPGAHLNDALSIWVFADFLQYSTSVDMHGHCHTNRQAMKIFWHKVKYSGGAEVEQPGMHFIEVSADTLRIVTAELEKDRFEVDVENIYRDNSFVWTAHPN